MCSMPHSYVWHDSFTCAPWLIHLYDSFEDSSVTHCIIAIRIAVLQCVTCLNVWHASRIAVLQCVTCLNAWHASRIAVLQCVTCLNVWHASRIAVLQCVTCLNAWHASRIAVLQCVTCLNAWHASRIAVSQYVTFVNAWHASLEWRIAVLHCEPCLIHTCHTTYSYVWHDLFIYGVATISRVLKKKL